MRYRVGFLTTHPIQYQVPIFRLLAQQSSLDFTTLYCQLPDERQQGAGFGVEFQWDVPLVDGYDYVVLKNVARSPSVTSYFGCDTPEIGAELRRRRFDALIVNGWVTKSCLQGLWASRRLKIPCVVRGEANLLRPRPWWKTWRHSRLVRKYSAYLYIGEENRRFYKRHGARDEQLFPALYCIETERFAAAARDKARQAKARLRWNLPADRVCYLFCGKFEPKKHPLRLVESIAAAVENGANIHLLMVGDGEQRASCEQLVAQKSLPVTFSGFLNQSEIIDAYLAADCLVLPSDYGETWGLVVNEAMACGKPAIVSDQVGCRRDLVLEGETGFSFPFGRWDELASRLAMLGSRPDELHKLGQAAARQVARYSPTAAAEGLVAAVKYVTESVARRSN